MFNVSYNNLPESSRVVIGESCEFPEIPSDTSDVPPPETSPGASSFSKKGQQISRAVATGANLN